MFNNKWDIIIAGGGLSGVSAAISAARKGCKALIIEKCGFLGGCATASLVTPMMKNNIPYHKNLNSSLYHEILGKLKADKNAATHSNGNPGWFNPEKMKIILDEMCEDSGVDLLFDTQITGVQNGNTGIKAVTCFNKGGFQELYADFYIDATGDADLAAYAGVKFEEDEHQSFTLRFNMENVDLYKFGDWLQEIEPEMELSSVEYNENHAILLTTAHTSENIGWKLEPYFKLGVRDEVIKQEDAEYFQIFTIPGQKNAVTFNCPRIYSKTPLNPLNPWDISYAYIQGRKQINRLENFCKTYLPGFEESYISQIAPCLGIRESRRITGKYKLSEEDVLKCNKFPNSAAKSNYPIDVHGNNKSENRLTHMPEDDYYDIPMESLIPVEISNLLVVGKCISATFGAQASARIQPNCIAMGEAAGIYCADIIKS